MNERKRLQEALERAWEHLAALAGSLKELEAILQVPEPGDDPSHFTVLEPETQ